MKKWTGDSAIKHWVKQEWLGSIHIEKQKGLKKSGVKGKGGGGSGFKLCVLCSCSRVTHLLSPIGAPVNLVSEVRRGVFQFLRTSFQAKTRAWLIVLLLPGPLADEQRQNCRPALAGDHVL